MMLPMMGGRACDCEREKQKKQKGGCVCLEGGEDEGGGM